MQRFLMCVTVLMTAWSGTAAIAQTKITTEEEYSKVMRSTAQAFGGVTNTMSAALFADAKGNLATAREGFVALGGFWADKKRDDAVGIVKGVLIQLDALDTLLALPPVSRSAALAVTKRVQGACVACHTLYREGDNQTGFRFKAGVF